jgi:hypothetical protein
MPEDVHYREKEEVSSGRQMTFLTAKFLRRRLGLIQLSVGDNNSCSLLSEPDGGGSSDTTSSALIRLK